MELVPSGREEMQYACVYDNDIRSLVDSTWLTMSLIYL